MTKPKTHIIVSTTYPDREGGGWKEKSVDVSHLIGTVFEDDAELIRKVRDYIDHCRGWCKIPPKVMDIHEDNNL